MTGWVPGTDASFSITSHADSVGVRSVLDGELGIATVARVFSLTGQDALQEPSSSELRSS